MRRTVEERSGGKKISGPFNMAARLPTARTITGTWSRERTRIEQVNNDASIGWNGLIMGSNSWRHLDCRERPIHCSLVRGTGIMQQ